MSQHRMPSTPNARSLHSNAPSTTPSGAPPTWLTDHTTTPVGPPPTRSTFNSSFNPSNDTFRRSHGPSTHAHNKHASFSVPDDEDDDQYEDAAYEEESEVEMPFMNSLPQMRGMKRSHDGRVQEPSAMAGIARRLTDNSPPAELHESENVILQSQSIVVELDAKVRRAPRDADEILLETTAQLTKLWSRSANAATKPGALGPQSTDPFTLANYIASLLLQLHHPHTANPQATSSASRPAARPNHGTTIPKGLLDWLNKYHLPFPDDFGAIHIYQPAPAAHESFWDVIYASALRGRLDRVVQLLRDAGWDEAVTALDDGFAGPGYVGHQLANTESVIGRCVRTIEGCPGYQHNDWDVKGVEWSIFRQRTRAALEDLETFAEGSNLDDSQAEGNVFQRSMRGSHMSLSTASRRAESKVPWSIYENLKLLYGLLLGQMDEILMTAQDWLEASLYLTIWWDGLDHDDAGASLGRSGMRKNNVQKTREVDIAPLAAYRRRLADAFATVTGNPQDAVFSVDTLDSVQVGIACVLDDSVGNAVRMLRKYSMTIAVSVVEIAALGDWLPLVRPRSGRDDLLDQEFSREDLLVLSHGPVATNPDDIDRDEFLCEYADQLARRQKISEHEGWELAVTILNRLDESSSARPRISDLLNGISLVDSARVDKVLSVCEDLEQVDQLRAIAERYADSLAEDTTTYGSALVYYARAHSVNKLKANLNHLTGLCLLHSTSTPPAGGTDHELEALVNKDRAALRNLASVDMEAGTLLSHHLAGYATLRQFYDLRDSSKPSSLVRRRAAAAALFAVIKSAADCIPGGLFDPEAETAIPAEGLLNLFGECLPLLGSGERIFTEKQVFALLGLLEDFCAAPGRIHEDAEGLLGASLQAYREESSTATGSFKQKKKDADLARSVGSSWDVLSMELSGDGNGKEAVVARGWDWRIGVVGLHESECGEKQIVGLVREGLVREVAKGWSGGLGW